MKEDSRLSIRQRDTEFCEVAEREASCAQPDPGAFFAKGVPPKESKGVEPSSLFQEKNKGNRRTLKLIRTGQ